MRDFLIKNFMEKKSDLKDKLKRIYKYSNNFIVKSLSTEDRLYLYEAKKVLDVEEVVILMKSKNMRAEQVYELESNEEEIRFELFKIIQNNFSINKCENY